VNANGKRPPRFIQDKGKKPKIWSALIIQEVVTSMATSASSYAAQKKGNFPLMKWCGKCLLVVQLMVAMNTSLLLNYLWTSNRGRCSWPCLVFIGLTGLLEIHNQVWQLERVMVVLDPVSISSISFATLLYYDLVLSHYRLMFVLDLVFVSSISSILILSHCLVPLLFLQMSESDTDSLKVHLGPHVDFGGLMINN
jgi:hypothetical protein